MLSPIVIAHKPVPGVLAGITAMAAAMDGLDAIVFPGGVGEVLG